MKIISVKQFYDTTLNTFIRFPLSLLFAFVVTFLSLAIISQDYSSNYPQELSLWTRSLYLGFLLSISVELFSEKRQLALKWKLIFSAVVIAFSVFYKFSVLRTGVQSDLTRYIVLSVTFHVLVSVSVIGRNQSVNDIWHFNKTIFLRILLAFLYSGVLFIGLSLAMLAIDKLFDIEMPFRIYAYLWALLCGVFNPWFFLAGLPRLNKIDITDDEAVGNYPRGLKIFTANILLPLVAIYMIILYLYVIKLIFRNEWDQTWISYMVLAFAFFGILSFLLLHPLGHSDKFSWVKKLSKIFYFLLLPLALLMLTSTLAKINDKGFTEDLYLLLILALWLIFAGIYSILKPSRNLIVLPLSLCLIGLFSTGGPLGMKEVSKRSQQKQLFEILSQKNLLVNGKIPKKYKHKITNKDLSDISGKINYLVNNDGYDALQPFFEDDLSKLPNEYNDPYYETTQINDLLTSKFNEEENNTTPSAAEKIEPDNTSKDETENEAFVSKLIYLQSKTLIPLKGYEWMGDFTANSDPDSTVDLMMGENKLSIRYVPDESVFELTYMNLTPIFIDLKPHLKKLMELPENHSNTAAVSFTGNNKQWSAKIICTSIQLNKVQEISATNPAGKVLIKVK